MTDEKAMFIESELRLDSIHAAFQRNKVYDTQASDKQRRTVRGHLDKLLIACQKEYEHEMPRPDKHIENIERLAQKMTEEFQDQEILLNKNFRFGTAQKALNLYLKYLWCLGKIGTPPHCPFDSIIIDELSDHLEEDHRKIKWTEITTRKEYEALVLAASHCNNNIDRSLAEWELEVYQRR